ncbi:MAG: ketoacyl-ACP synthase III [Deltaproteobacteria bacterium]|nr:MAG: ketoacyl-ACP synthase III [Deltaproteobacteria bacterium]
MHYHVGIIGTGSYVPEKILTNHDLEKMVETSDKWILERTGIRERRIAGEEETNVTMGRLALGRAIEAAGIEPGDIDMLVAGTNTTEPAWPSAAGHIARLLNLRRNVPFFDLQAGCTGFNYALATAELFVKSGQYKTVAVVGSDKLSAITDYKDRNTCVLFGDGAGAVVLQRQTREGIIRSHLGGEYRSRDHLILRRNGDNGHRYMWMEGKKVYAFARGAMAESCLRVLDPEGSASREELSERLTRVDRIIPHQANVRIIYSAAQRLESKLELPEGAVKEKMIVTIEKYGNNSTASIPLALDVSLREKKLRRGNLVILVGFGAGLTYGANLVRL